MSCAPKSSTLNIIELISVFTTPQNKATRPIAALNPGSNPRYPPTTHPNVAPTKKVGTISPPLYPTPIVTAVNIIFKINASILALPFIALVIISIPAPL